MMRWLLLLAVALPASGEVSTVVHPEEEFDDAGPVVWSPLFQAGWDRMESEMGGGVLKVEPPNPLIGKLSAFEWDADAVMPAAAWQVWSGPATKQFLAQANREAKALVGDEEEAFRPFPFDPRHRAYLGLMLRSLDFRKEFYRSQRRPLVFTNRKGKRSQVAFFGVRGELSGYYRDEVRVLDCQPLQNSHALQVLSKQGDETVVLYRPALPQGFATACEFLRDRMKEHGQSETRSHGVDDRWLHEKDDVRVPYLSVETDAMLTDRLKGVQWTKERVLPREVMHASQRTAFVLHERGARVKVVTDMSMEPFGPPPPKPKHVPRRFFYDAPFFVFLWRDGADWPYLGCWVGDAEVLEEFAAVRVP